jgi:hypothetical protein
MRFGAVVAKIARKPDCIVVLRPSDFAFNWHKKPETEIALGLRTISEKDVQAAKGEASKEMIKMYGDGDTLRDPEKAWECWNDSFLAFAISRAACDPNNADAHYFQWGQDEARKALSSHALRRLWDEYELMARGTGERRQITDDELGVLASSLRAGAVASLDNIAGRETRKHLAHVFDTLAKAGLLTEEDEDGDVYVVKG